MKLEIVPISFPEAAAFTAQHHRHRPMIDGHKFSIAAALVSESISVIVGVAIIGRPIARLLDDGWTLEVTRCTTDGTRNACSMLYRAAWRAAKALGYRRLVTYTRENESGASLRGAGFVPHELARTGGAWSTTSRPRVNVNPRQATLRWEVSA